VNRTELDAALTNGPTMLGMLGCGTAPWCLGSALSPSGWTGCGGVGGVVEVLPELGDDPAGGDLVQVGRLAAQPRRVEAGVR
jgi:hypothetical protein